MKALIKKNSRIRPENVLIISCQFYLVNDSKVKKLKNLLTLTEYILYWHAGGSNEPLYVYDNVYNDDDRKSGRVAYVIFMLIIPYPLN